MTTWLVGFGLVACGAGLASAFYAAQITRASLRIGRLKTMLELHFQTNVETRRIILEKLAYLESVIAGKRRA